MIRQENNGIEGFDVAELIFVYYTDELKLSKQSFSLVNNALTAKVSKYLQRIILDTSLYFRLYFVWISVSNFVNKSILWSNIHASYTVIYIQNMKLVHFRKRYWIRLEVLLQMNWN